MTLPPKLQNIEDKLQKYRDEATRQMQSCREQAQYYAAQEFEYQQSLRAYEREKLKLNKNYWQSREQQFKNSFKKHEARKQLRLDNFDRVETFLTNKIKTKIINEREDDSQQFYQGIDYFQNKCIQLGIELKKDINNQKTSKNSYLSTQTLMSKIRERNQQRSKAILEKEKRQRKMQVDGQKEYMEFQRIKEEENLTKEYNQMNIDSYQFNVDQMNNNFKRTFEFNKNVKQQNLQKELQLQSYKDQIDKQFEKSIQNEPSRRSQYTDRQKDYRLYNFKSACKSRGKHNELVTKDIINFMLDFTEDSFYQNHENDYPQMTSEYYRKTSERFEKNQPFKEEKILNIFKTITKTSQKLNDIDTSVIDDYLLRQHDWNLDYESENIKFKDIPFQNKAQSIMIDRLVDVLYPKKSIPKFLNFPKDLSVKISIIGVTSSFVQKKIHPILQKYPDIKLINPLEHLKSIEKIMFQETQHDPKKPAKKGVVEDEKPALSEEDMFLAQEYHKLLSEGKEATDQLLIDVIFSRLNELYPTVPDEELLNQIQSSNHELLEIKQEEFNQTQTRLRRSLKVQQPEKETPEVMLENLIKKKDHFHVKGFILVNFPLTKNQHNLLEENTTGFIFPHQLLNDQGVKLKHSLEKTIPLVEDPEFIMPTSGIDSIIHFQMTEDNFYEEQNHTKIDPQTQIVYHMEDNPPPKDVKGIVERLVPYQLPIDYHQFTQSVNEMKQFSTKFTSLYHEYSTQGHVYDYIEPIDTLFDDIIFHNEDKLLRDLQTEKEEEVEETNPTNLIKLENLDLKQIEFFIKNQIKIDSKYLQEIQTEFIKTKEQRSNLVNKIDELQKAFLSNIECPNPKISSLEDFQDSYNRFLNEQPTLAQKKGSIATLETKLQNLYQIFWEFIQNKKESLVNERQDIINSQWIENEQETLFLSYLKLMQIEIDRFVEQLGLIQTLYVDNHELEEIQVEQILIDPSKIKDFDENELKKWDKVYDKVEKSVLDINHIIDNALEHSKKHIQPASHEFEEESQQLIDALIQGEFNRTKNRIILLENMLNCQLREIQYQSISINEKLDDWIIFGLKTENDIINGCLEDIKCAVQGQIKCNIRNKHLSISHILRQIHFFREERYSLPCYESINPNRITIGQLKIMMEEMFSISGKNYKVNNYHFKKYFLSRKKYLPKFLASICSYQLNKVLTKLQDEGSLNLKKIMTYLILLSSEFPSEVQITNYSQQLSKNMTKEEFSQVPTWFDSNEEEPLQRKNIKESRLKYIKFLLYELYKTEVNFLNQNGFDFESMITYMTCPVGQQMKYYQYIIQ